ncbi:orotate phosphoribosyltransferase [Oceanicaulis alexandrii]|jgi:orotate phosphoribosyltransferase|uniref:orotate phosphoribosyltransferase n=1 Tax=Oceanicaulis alexandrii TaxID=153233 RepID=UPI0003B409A1|nr:orotate phosphoribosyltransferase [Oceanicaulis alexandrii]MBL4540004.1 orotate phosphoribosyltransferase [Oceanicaulis sp.]VXC54186.1 Orotate phosphoribosyltransferase [Oceanicaulis sp. 350]
MTTEDVLAEFKEAGALLEGHFILSSGLRSPVFLQKALVFRDAARTERLCKALADALKAAGHGPFTAIVSPAMGGIIPGYETSRHMHLPFMFVERENGEFALRRGFELTAADRVLVIEDIVTTGLSSRECITAIEKSGAKVVAEGCLVDRSGGKADVGVPLVALATVNFPAYPADALPEELERIPAIKPGSRGLA